MKYFYAVVHKDADSGFGVIFPDLPGCFSAADRLEDVLPNAVEALELWFEDADEVDPRPVDQVREAVKEDLAQGAFLMAVPRITSANKLDNVMDHIEQVRAAVADALEERGISNKQFIAEIREGRRDDGPYMVGALAWRVRCEDAVIEAERKRVCDYIRNDGDDAFNRADLDSGADFAGLANAIASGAHEVKR